ncbi:molybdenum cofactor biosynthesis protein MoaE [Membranihabitans maritimus]|uniref:molybdenum cofactor biosynthesis protein MoaE n=1 Tax=Membranihabitans maritimus TaxID=2904244 RepID=UPI001F3AA008|nr:molybdenum cofactor biosynthesis protein MoaE [Membranihabitans maritimus]
MKKKGNFIEGAIPPGFVAEVLTNHQLKHHIGAHNFFLGQVRADKKEGSEVSSIEFSAYEEMAVATIKTIREEAFEKYHLSCLHIYHSLGKINVGEICFFVMVSAPHRPEVYEATEFLVNEIKNRVPIFGKELLKNKSYIWKENN